WPSKAVQDCLCAATLALYRGWSLLRRAPVARSETMMPAGPPASLATVPEATSADVAPAASAPHIVSVSFHKEQERRRRQAWRLSLVCLVLALALGLAMSAIFGPLLLAIAGGMLKLAALLGCTEVCGDAARGIATFARTEMRALVAIGDHIGKATTLDDKLAVA